MEQSPAPPESPDKAAETVVEPGALGRFKRLAASLFSLDPERFKDALAKDERERAKRRALNPAPPGRRSGAGKRKG